MSSSVLCVLLFMTEGQWESLGARDGRASEEEAFYLLFLIHYQCSRFYIFATVYRVWVEVGIITPILQMKKLRLGKVYFFSFKNNFYGF